MSRKKKSRYESFSFGGQTYAPESVWFKLNDKPIKIADHNKKRDLQYKAICGKYKEVVAELKRMERKEAREKKVKHITFCFFVKDSNRYYCTRDLKADINDLHDRLRVYKEWKHYIQENDCKMLACTIQEGTITPYGKSEPKEREKYDLIDLTRCKKIGFYNPIQFEFQKAGGKHNGKNTIT